MSGYFYTQKHLAEFRRLIDVNNSYRKREGLPPLKSYDGVACGCGCGPFISNRETTLNAPPAPQPKKPTKRKSKVQHHMFSGNIID